MKNRFKIEKITVLILMAVFLSGCSALQESDTLEGTHHSISCPPNDNQVNCKVPPAPTECLLPGSPEAEHIEFSNGDVILVEPGVRAAGTRSPVHTHPNTGATCVLQGEMTLTLEGEEDQTFYGNLLSLTSGKPGTVECYPMPAPSMHNEHKMSATNTGTTPAYIVDLFPVPKGDDWKTFKPLCVLQNEGLPTDPACYTTGDGCTKTK